MKLAPIFCSAGLLLTSVAAFGQFVPFDACDSTFFYVKAGPKVVQTKEIAGTMTTIYEEVLKRVGNTGEVNGLAANYKDGYVYYQNKSGGIGYLIRIDANGDTLMIANLGTMGYTSNGAFDACNRYLRFKNNLGIIRYDVTTGFQDTILVPGLATSPDIMYNPYNGLTYHYTNADAKVTKVGPDGTVLGFFNTGVFSAGSVSLTQDGSQFVVTNDNKNHHFNINTGTPEGTKTLPPTAWAANAPIADNCSFVCDDVNADISSGLDTLEIHTCQDSVTIDFANYSSGTQNKFYWNFGDGSSLDSTSLTPSHTFLANSTYTVAYQSSKFTYGTCHLDEPNYDTLVVVIVPDTLQATVTGTDPQCFDGTDGSGEVTLLTGGTAPYSYVWSPVGGTGALASGLGWGTYSVTVTDSNACTLTDSVVLNNPAMMDATLSTIDVTCNGAADGSATVVPGAAAVGVYTYLYTTGGTSGTESGLSAGAYSVTVYDAGLCELVFPFNIVEPTAVVANAGNDTLICINGGVSLNPTAVGGNGAPYTYIWTGLPAGTTSVNPLVNTCYELTAFDVNGCASIPDVFCVTLNAPLNIDLVGPAICPGQTTDVSAVVTGGDGVYTYSWTASGSPFGATGPDFSDSPSATTLYCLSVNDGCETPTASECISIVVFDIPVVTLTPAKGCEGLTMQFPFIPGGGTGFHWTFGDGGSADSPNPEHTYQNWGDYTVTVEFTSADGCFVSETFENLVTILETPHAHFSYNPQEITVENTEVFFTNSSDGATSYVWNFGDGTPETTLSDPDHTFPDAPNVSYTVTLYAFNEMCQDSTVVLITVKDVVIYYVPNAFTPDGNSSNDEFKPVITAGIDVYDYHLTIFNRWGERVFESYDPAYGWNGTYGNEGLADDGTYVWQLIFKETMSDKMHEQAGHVTMLR